MDLFTRALALVAPSAALRRAHALRALRAYDAAGNGRRLKNWKTSVSGPVDEVGNSLAKLRSRSRDLVRNNPYAAHAIAITVAYQVGFGIMPRPNLGSDRANKGIKTLFADWSKRCDAAGHLDFYGIQALAARARCQDGEMLVRFYRGTPTRENPVPLTLQVLEADQLDDAKSETPSTGNRIANGIEIDARGKPVAYWLFPQHPGDAIAMPPRGNASVRIPAEDIIHLYRMDRAGQLRGVPDIAPVTTRMRGLDDYQEAELERARVQACLAAFVTSNGAPNNGPLAGQVPQGETERRTTFAPGMIEQLLPGEGVEFVAPPAGGSYDDHTKAVLRAIAVGLGVTYHQLTGDLTAANYSSLRAGNIDFRRLTGQAQWLMLVPLLCQRVWDEFIRVAILANALRPRAAGYPVTWVPPAFEAVDPLKDTQAIGQELDLGLTSPQRAIAAQGEDPDEILAERAEWKAKAEAAGLGMPAPKPGAPADDPAADAAPADDQPADEKPAPKE